MNQATTPQQASTATTVQVAAALRAGACSGQDLAERLGVSRAAVHKAVETLRAAGFTVDAQPGRGYVLGQVPDTLSAEVMVPLLEPGAFGHAGWVFMPATESTNTAAAQLARAGAAHGTVVVADAQTAGRGRRGRTFASPPGTGAYFTVILRPPLPPQYAFRLTLCGALAVRSALDELGMDARLKWPNDVLVNGKKLCGVLTELSADAERIHQALMGVGLNINTPLHAFPEDVRDIATSVAVVRGAPVERPALLARVMHHAAAWYRLTLDDFPSVVDAARRCSHTLGRKVKVTDGHEERVGEAVDLDADGALLLRTDAGIIRILGGDVEPLGGSPVR